MYNLQPVVPVAITPSFRREDEVNHQLCATALVEPHSVGVNDLVRAICCLELELRLDDGVVRYRGDALEVSVNIPDCHLQAPTQSNHVSPSTLNCHTPSNRADDAANLARLIGVLSQRGVLMA